jgi:hypothetical protein
MNSYAGITDNTTWTFSTKESESTDVSILSILLASLDETSIVSYGAPIVEAEESGVLPVHQRVVYKTSDTVPLKILSMSLAPGAMILSPVSWDINGYDLFNQPLDIVVLAEDNTQVTYRLSIPGVEPNHMANIVGVKGDNAYGRGAAHEDGKIVMRTMHYDNSYAITNVRFMLSDSAVITINGIDSIHTASLPMLDLSAPLTFRVVSENGDSTKYWEISATDIGKAAVPVHFRGSVVDSSRVLCITDEPGWLASEMMNGYPVEGDRRPSRMNVAGAYVLLALDDIGDSLYYRSRVGADRNYNMEVRESSDGVNWKTLIRHNKDQNQLYGRDADGNSISSYNVPEFGAKLDLRTRYIQWYLHSPGDEDNVTQVRLDDIRVTERTSLSREAKIDSFFIGDTKGIVIESLKSIGVNMPGGTDVTALVPTIYASYLATVNPSSGTAQDFTNPVEYTVTAEDGTSVMYRVTVIVEADTTTTGVKRGEMAEFTLYPNPTAGVVNIGTDDNVSMVEVYSQVGILMYTAKVEDKSVDFSGLSSGLYYVKVTLSNGKSGIRLMMIKQ